MCDLFQRIETWVVELCFFVFSSSRFSCHWWCKYDAVCLFGFFFFFGGFFSALCNASSEA